MEMVEIDELPKDLQQKIGSIRNGIRHMSNHPCDPSFPNIYGVSAYFSMGSFVGGEDSWYLMNHEKDGINNLKDLFSGNGYIDLLRDLIEMEETLKRLPTNNPYE